MKPSDCPRFENCSAPICPLDRDWRIRTHLQGERVCGLLCELVKQGGYARLERRLPREVVQTLARVAPDLAASWPRIRAQLEQSALTGSRIEGGQWLKRNYSQGGDRDQAA